MEYSFNLFFSYMYVNLRADRDHARLTCLRCFTRRGEEEDEDILTFL